MSNSVWVIVAPGPNDISIPCLFFPTKEAAETYVDDASKGRDVKKSYNKQGLPIWVFDGDKLEQENREELNAVYKHEQYGGEQYQQLWKSTFFGHFFTSYYGGCGGVYDLVLEEIPFATPSVAWNLD